MTREDIIARYCLLASEVWNTLFDPTEHANDCFCKRGGFWSSPSYSDKDFRNSGAALEWIEQTVRAALGNSASSDGGDGVPVHAPDASSCPGRPS